MSANTVLPAEPELALASISRVLFDVLIVAGVAQPKAIDRLLEIYQKGWERQKCPTAAGIVGLVRALATDPQRQQS